MEASPGLLRARLAGRERKPPMPPECSGTWACDVVSPAHHNHGTSTGALQATMQTRNDEHELGFGASSMGRWRSEGRRPCPAISGRTGGCRQCARSGPRPGLGPSPHRFQERGCGTHRPAHCGDNAVQRAPATPEADWFRDLDNLVVRWKCVDTRRKASAATASISNGSSCS